MFMDVVAGSESAAPVLGGAHPPSQGPLRLDAGASLKRFHFLEQALVRSCAAWIPSVHLIETKALLARIAWECSLSGDALRERVFELRFPSRLMEVALDAELVASFRNSVDAPTPVAFLHALGTVYLPALRHAEQAYLDVTDVLADGPTERFLRLSIAEKERAIEELASNCDDERAIGGRATDGAEQHWLESVRPLLSEPWRDAVPEPPAGTPEEAPPAATAHQVPSEPARDPRYHPCSFYWPDTLDPDYGYGSGIRLQLRSAVSHLNEVWAVEVAGATLYELSDELGWEFMLDAARWTYDEARHMMMGQRRIATWGLPTESVPLGRYIYDASAAGGDPIYRIGMLGFFETKNIGKKNTRADAFAAMGDELSQRDMQFDWADETIHAEYGRRWLKRLLELRGRSPEEYATVLEECESLVRRRIEQAEPGELEAVRACAERLVEQSEQLAALPR